MINSFYILPVLSVPPSALCKQSVLLTQRKTVFTPCLQDLSYKQNLPERLLTSSDKV